MLVTPTKAFAVITSNVDGIPKRIVVETFIDQTLSFLRNSSGRILNKLHSSVDRTVMMGDDCQCSRIASKGKERLAWGKGKGCAGQASSLDGPQASKIRREMHRATTNSL